MRQPQKWRRSQNEDTSEHEDNLKNEDVPKTWDTLKKIKIKTKKTTLKMKMIKKWGWPQQWIEILI